MRRVVALFLEERGEIVDLLHAATPTPMLAAKLSKSASARATNPSRFLARSFTGGSSGSSRPKFAFIGWEGAGAPPPRERDRAPSIVLGGGSKGAAPPRERAQIMPARMARPAHPGEPPT